MIPEGLQQSQGVILAVIAGIILLIMIAAAVKSGGKGLIGLIILGIIAYFLISAEVFPLR